MTETESVAVSLPTGVSEVPVALEGAEAAWAVLMIAHGAGAGKDHPFLTGFAAALRGRGIGTARFDFPYVVAGRRMPGPATHAIAAWRAVRDHVAARVDVPLWAGGKSYGGRMASMSVAEGLDVAGLVYLGYPLHPPGRPDKPRAEHLPQIAVPQLFVEGENDPFIQPPDQFRNVIGTCQDATVEWIPGGGHSFEVKGNRRAASDIGASMAPAVAAFLRARAPGPG